MGLYLVDQLHGRRDLPPATAGRHLQACRRSTQVRFSNAERFIVAYRTSLSPAVVVLAAFRSFSDVRVVSEQVPSRSRAFFSSVLGEGEAIKYTYPKVGTHSYGLRSVSLLAFEHQFSIVPFRRLLFPAQNEVMGCTTIPLGSP
jgi:hypothetical protein